MRLHTCLRASYTSLSTRETRALVDSGASASTIIKDKTNVSNTYTEKHIQVQSYDSKKTFYEERAIVIVGFKGQSIEIVALATDVVG